LKRDSLISRRAVGLRLRALRKACGWTLADVAARLGIRPMTAANHECGARLPKLETLVAMSILYRRSLDFLVAGCPRRSELWRMKNEGP